MESFHSVLKKEGIYLHTYQDSKEARRAIFKYIEGWYNRKRIHIAIDYITPQQKEDEGLKKQHNLSTFFVQSIDIDPKLILRLDLCQWLLIYSAWIGGDEMVRIDFNNINDKIIYEAVHVEGNEAEALNDSYLGGELIGRDAMLKLFTHFHGDKIDCPVRNL
nr:IS3 family transposase [Parablautia intestinalis]